jgi:DNA-binding MarR family transcriptional regulator
MGCFRQQLAKDLDGFAPSEIDQLRSFLNRITQNMQQPSRQFIN